MKRAFVTGGSGFVGGRVIRQLRAREVEVGALARSPTSATLVESLGATAVRGDLDDRAAIQAGMTGADVVIHAAAHVEEHGPIAEFLRVTVTGTENVLAAARAAGVPRLVHVSTEAVLADGKPIVRADETRPRTTRPVGPYSLSKGLAEERVLAANRDGLAETERSPGHRAKPEAPDQRSEGSAEFDVRGDRMKYGLLATVIVRPRFIWGAGDTNLLPKIVEAVKRGRFGWIGGGRYLTSTCHVDNVVAGILLAAERGAPGEIYFLTDGEPVEFRAFLTQVLATYGVDPGDRNVPRWLARTVAALTGWMKRPPVTRTAVALVGQEVTVVDAKARRELGYVGHVSRERGLAEMRGA